MTPEDRLESVERMLLVAKVTTTLLQIAVAVWAVAHFGWLVLIPMIVFGIRINP